MKNLFFGLMMSVGGVAFGADNVCYQLSADGTAFSKTPELLCVKEVGDKYEITLTTANIGNAETHATFVYDLLVRARCIDCNADVFGVANPSNSLFNNLRVSFNGKLENGKEVGTVTIGKTKFHYKFVK